jgi:predicted DCC family thiol-disulfide oxidoreductase YuxK
MERLTVLYDAGCGLCTGARRWLERQRALVPLDFVPAGSEAARQRFPGLSQADPPEELVVVDDEGGVYRGDPAWILCLYALEEYREWSFRLAGPGLGGLARAAFAWISHNRREISRRLALSPDDDVKARLGAAPPPPCRPPVGEAPGACRRGGASPAGPAPVHQGGGKDT